MSEDSVGGWPRPPGVIYGGNGIHADTADDGSANTDDWGTDLENLFGHRQSPTSPAPESVSDGSGGGGDVENDQHQSDAENELAPAVALKGVAVKSFVRQQLSMARYFATHAHLSIPIFIIWVASFGGSLHGPVTTFFLLDLGVTEVQIGHVGFLIAAGPIVLAPLYGWFLDHGFKFWSIWFSCLFCGLGCLLRGLAVDWWLVYAGAAVIGLGAPLWNVVLTHVSAATPPRHRSLAISAFQVQETTLRLAAKACYPVFDGVLRLAAVRDRMARYRLTMIICPAFCLFGVVALLTCSSPATIDGRAEGGRSGQAGGSGACAAAAATVGASSGMRRPRARSDGGGAGSGGGSAAVPAGSAGEDATPHQFWLLATVLLLQSAAVTAGSVLWPFHLRDVYGYGSEEYAWFSLVGSVCATAVVAAFPKIERLVGGGLDLHRHRLPVLLACTAAAAAAVGFRLRGTGPLAVVLHGVLVGVFMSAGALLGVSLRAVAAKSHVGGLGRSFGLFSTMAGLGQMFGNLWSTFVYHDFRHVDGGNLPFTLICATLFLAATVLQAMGSPPPVPLTGLRHHRPQQPQQ